MITVQHYHLISMSTYQVLWELHQTVTNPGNSKPIQYRNTLCACTRLRGDYRKCECLDQFKNYLKPINMTTHTSSISKEKQKDLVDDEDELIDLDEDKLMSGKICILKQRLQNSLKKVILL